MSYVRVYQSRVNWENLPSMRTPLNEYNLNKLDYAAYIHDEAIDELYIMLENIDLPDTIHTIDYSPSTNELIITYWDGDVQRIHLNDDAGSLVSIDDLLQSGTKIATLTIDDVDYDIYSPPSGSTVSVTRSLTSGTKIGTITVNGTGYDMYAPNPGSSVSVSRSVTSGTKIARITVDGTNYDLYAPSGGSTVSVSRSLTSGTQIATITVDGTSYTLYCESGSYVTVTKYQTTGTKICRITVDGYGYDIYAPSGGGGSTVTVTRSLTSGTKIATITVDGTGYDLYAPSSGGGSYPDYGNASNIAMSANSAYTAPSDGFFIIIQSKAQTQGAAYELTINGTTVANGPSSAVKGDQSPLFPVKQGDRIVSTKAFTTGNQYANAYFIPAR